MELPRCEHDDHANPDPAMKPIATTVVNDLTNELTFHYCLEHATAELLATSWNGIRVEVTTY